MAEIRKLGFDPEEGFWVGHQCADNPTDAELVVLLARVLEAAGHRVPTYTADEIVHEADAARAEMAVYLGRWRAALARAAAQAEEDREIEALRDGVALICHGEQQHDEHLRSCVPLLEEADRNARGEGS